MKNEVGGPEALSLEERRWYLGVLLHALNQPLTAVASFVEAARVGVGAAADPAALEALEAAREESVRAVGLARELRAVLGHRNHRPHSPVELNEQLEDLAPDLPGEAGTRVRLELDRVGALVRVDPFTLRRAVLALVRGGLEAFGKGDVTTVLRTRSGASGPVCEVVLQDGSSGDAPQQALRDLLDRGVAPIRLGLARSALTDLGCELMLDAPDPRSLRFLITFPKA